MSQTNKYNFFKLVEEQLEWHIRKKLKDILTKRAMLQVESEIKKEVEDLVDKLVFDAIAANQDLYKFKDQFDVYVHWRDKNEKS